MTSKVNYDCSNGAVTGIAGNYLRSLDAAKLQLKLDF